MKCKHKKTITKYLLDKKYGEDIAINYTFCSVCNTIISGNTQFVKPLKLKKVNRNKKQKIKIPTPEHKNVVKEPEVKDDNKDNIKVKKEDKTNKVGKKPNPKKPICNNIGDFVKESYSKSKSKYPEVDIDQLDDDDIDIFLK